MTENMTSKRDPGDVAGAMARSSSGIIALGTVTVIAGIAVLAWPSATAKVIAVIFGIFALVSGVFQLASAIAADRPATGGGARVLLAVSGVLSLLLGIVCLRHPFQTLEILTLLLGMFWVVTGVVGVVHALGSREMAGRGFAVFAGVVSVIAGIVLLAYPSVSLLVLVWLLGVELLLTGAVAVGWGIAARRDRSPSVRAHAAHHAPGPA
ncbi:MAG TPA: DUF308 domain-containing protein [Amycolatopsis sp.]|nr:DUF308 domain-containing protein [Amycolatopsis sp.]